ncbi:hypothetical protein [Xenorhabdus bharatensis]|uniref:phage tail fiber protein n=1 Tax=Xenorhabdus bharatensis TaxID=3136256 RepID=UPI0030F3AC29
MMYTQGTLSTVSGSAIVRGTGTKFKDNLNGIAPGQMMIIQSGSRNLLHMIQAVNSDTELVLADNVNVTLNNVTYQIQTTVHDTISDAARHMVAINAYIVQFLQNMDQWMTQNGAVAVTLPNGQTVSLQSIKAMNETLAGKLDKSQNGADILDKSEFVQNIGLNNVLKIGDYGFGGIGNIVAYDEASILDFIRLNPSQIFRNNLGSDFTYRWASGIICKAGDTFSGFTAHYEGAGVKFFAGHNTAAVYYSVWTDKNTHVDNGGIIREASPIIEIFPSGKFTTNDESEGAIVSKPGLGHYQVTGVLGYNADGAWGVHGGISSPKNNNGLELIYIDDKVNKDGSITIETFHRQHSHLPARFQNKRIKAIVNGEKVYYQDGEPCDIPEGCRLDVRVQMPANSVWNVKQKAAEVAIDSVPAELVE